MRCRRKNKSDKKLKISVVLSFLILIVICSFFFKESSKTKAAKEAINENYSELKKLEEVDVAEVEKKLDEKLNKGEGKKVDTPQKSTQKSNKLYFEDSVFMGDSLTEPLDFYDILNKSSVLAKKGQNVITAKPAASGLANLTPKRVFLLYGLNDLDMFQNVSDFKKNYTNLIKEVKNNAPKAEIYVQSVMPVQERISNKNRNYSPERVDKFVEAVKEMDKEENINFIDIRSVVKGKEYLYEPDGMHFTIKFYDLWLDYLKNYLDNSSKKQNKE